KDRDASSALKVQNQHLVFQAPDSVLVQTSGTMFLRNAKMFTLLQTAASETTKNTTQAFDNTPVPDLDDLTIVLLISIYACFMFALLKYVAITCFDSNCDLYSVIAQQQQQRTRRADRRRLRAEPLPAYAEQDPMEWGGLLHPDAGCQSPPPAYLTVFVPDEARMRDGSGTNGDAAVLPPPYLQPETQNPEVNMPTDAVYMV
ncbi:hypothetical protein LX32DRAFT_711683, partial [Colletotrichum zoysiae]